MHKINLGNIKEWAANYTGPQFDGILCDPPYELGFMGKSWDSSGIAFDTEMWADLFRHIKPGGHLLAFSGSRTYHRMAVAIEDAGFEIRDMIEWVYGSGFPKSLNIGKAVDKLQGNEREVLPPKVFPDGSKDRKTANHKFYADVESQENNFTNTKGTSEWEGYGTALKPAHEPCVLARKPLDKGMTVAGNVLKHGTGGLNIDGTRVAGDMGADRALGKPRIDTDKYGKANPTLNPQSPLGRFPANLIHDGSDEVVGLFPDTVPTSYATSKTVKGGMFGMPGHGTERIKDTTRSAARFFYCAKASKSERNAGLEGFEEVIRNDGKDETLASGHMPQNRSNTPKANHHPTVKPLSLTKYLANLIKPPTGGRLLVPFSGSGSEMIGALQAGWEYVEGVELTEEYIPIAEARIKYWLEQKAEEDSKPKQSSLI